VRPLQWYERFDAFQRRHTWLGLPLAVRQKYSDDQGGYLAATITYYAFFSIFPLLLVLVSVLGFVLRGHSGLQRRIVGSALGQFPVIGHDLHVHALAGNGLVLALGAAAALWSGMGVFLAVENAMNQLWGVPFRRRPDFLRLRLRALGLLLVLGTAALASTAIGGATSVGAGLGAVAKVAAVVASTVLNFGLFWVSMRLLTTHDVGWRCLRGGAAAAAVAYTLLQVLGGYYVNHVLKHASSTYGAFGLVIGLLSWVYLSVHVLLLAAEANVVATRRLWPRSFSILLEQPATAADERALTQRSRVEERRQDEQIDVTFRPSRHDTGGRVPWSDEGDETVTDDPQALH
jgi:inner membrane protein YhjD